MTIPVQGRLMVRPKFIPYAFLRSWTSLRRYPRRSYATHHQLGNSGTTRKAVTLASDDGRIPWSELSTGEKLARSTQQSFNFAVILIGMIATGGVGWFLYQEVFSMDSKTHHFNEAHARVKKDNRCVELLGDPKKIRAYGESTWNRWTRNRRIASTLTKDKTGTEHLYMHFNVEGPLGKGVVRLHMTKAPERKKFEYRYLALDVPGHQRIYLENADAEQRDNKKGGKMFGVRWW